MAAYPSAVILPFQILCGKGSSIAEATGIGYVHSLSHRSKKLNIILFVISQDVSMPNLKAPDAAQKKFELFRL